MLKAEQNTHSTTCQRLDSLKQNEKHIVKNIGSEIRYAEFKEKFGNRIFATPKKMGAETAEANINAGLAAAHQICDFFATGCTKFQVNK